jgi:hypothetical protein
VEEVEAGEAVAEFGDAPVAEALVEDSAEVEQVEDEPAEDEPAEPEADDVSVEADADTVAHASSVAPEAESPEQSDS